MNKKAFTPLEIPKTPDIKAKSLTGFTLEEFLLVILIITILMAVSIVLFSRLTERTRLETASRSIASTLRAARSYAITNNAIYYVKFEVANRKYYITDVNSVLEGKEYRLPGGVIFYRPGVGADPVTFDNDRASFKSTGSLGTTTGAAAFIADEKNTSKWKRIVVIKSTGAVKIDEVNEDG